MLTRLAVGLEPLNALDAAHRSPRSAPLSRTEFGSPVGPATRRSIKRNKELAKCLTGKCGSQVGHLLNRHFHFAHVGTTNTFVYGGKIILNGIANVLHRFLLGFSLRPATGKRGAIHRVTFFRLMKHDLISEAHRRTLYRERHKLQRTLCRPNLAGSMRARCAFWFVCLYIKPQTSDIKHQRLAAISLLIGKSFG
jgi:hypothetical protein